jgi:hypothetical protein
MVEKSVDEQEFNRKTRDEVEKRTGKTPEQLFAEGQKELLMLFG